MLSMPILFSIFHTDTTFWLTPKQNTATIHQIFYNRVSLDCRLLKRIIQYQQHLRIYLVYINIWVIPTATVIRMVPVIS